MSALSFDRVSYQYPGEDFDIIDELSFEVQPGSFHCILGVSGCGKSTIFRMTNGLLPPKKGNDPREWNPCQRSWKLLRLHASEGSAVSLAQRG